ncbi:prolipoprotein diacylglyceryl transferase [Alphaproteobacteria bacterium KMM 3653]|uniref:Phosphatidylglycerol--prolipoprotein diacylglyceryl transferase n=1 Tax=Harenicola maris TaxID=2841044 RepID=A0AAP2CUY7_9RHOB|nr:prolipoprotein diacylglyceryl transferase [Harenicola maris]
MQMLIDFPQIDPRIFHFNAFGIEIALRWYALAYIAGILLGWRLAVRLVKSSGLWPGGKAPFTPPQLEDFLTWVILGVVLGGRLGFVLFYKPGYYLENPGEILKVWEGGMAFHGGLIGVVLAAWIYTARHAIPRLSAADMMAVVVPPALMFGRLANFINAELYGRASDAPWAMKFPTLCQSPALQGCSQPGQWFFYGDEIARHPSQLYQAGLEGALLASVLLYLAWRTKALQKPGMLAGVFFAGYGMARIVVEYFRQPDAQFVSPGNPIGFVIGEGAVGVTMGQILSLPMVALGLGLILWARRRAAAQKAAA